MPTMPVTFKKGLLVNLPSTKSAGTLYITTDERAIYFDTSAESRIRIGDFQEVANLDALEAIENPSQSALFYLTTENILCKWNGSQYVQINKDTDTGATSVGLNSGDTGNAVTSMSYDPSTRKITFRKETVFALPSDVATAKSEVIGASTDAASANTIYGAKAYADAAADAKDTAISAAQSAADAAQGDVDALETLVGSIPSGATATTVTGYAKEVADSKDSAISAAASAASAAQGDVDALETLVGTIPSGASSSTVTAYAKELADAAQAAATYDDTALSGRVTAIENDYLTSTDKTALETSIGLKQDALGFEGSYDKTTNKVVTRAYMENAISGLTGAMHFRGVVTSFPANPENGDIVIKGNKEYVYATSDSKWHELGDETIYAVKGEIVDADIASNAAIAQSKIAGLTTDIARIGVIEGKESDWDDAASKAHTHSNKTVLDGIGSSDVAAWDAAEQNAKDYADGLASNYDAAGAASTVKSEVIGASTDAKTANTIYGAKAFATDAASTAQSSAQTYAKNYADGLASNYDAAGAAATAKSEVIGNASTDTSSSKTIEGTRKYVDEQVSAGLSWIDF